MPATILPFERRDPAAPEPRRQADRLPSLRVSLPSAKEIAHRWAMLSHLRRHFARKPPDLVR